MVSRQTNLILQLARAFNLLRTTTILSGKDNYHSDRSEILLLLIESQKQPVKIANDTPWSGDIESFARSTAAVSYLIWPTSESIFPNVSDSERGLAIPTDQHCKVEKGQTHHR